MALPLNIRVMTLMSIVGAHRRGIPFDLELRTGERVIESEAIVSGLGWGLRQFAFQTP